MARLISIIAIAAVVCSIVVKAQNFAGQSVPFNCPVRYPQLGNITMNFTPLPCDEDCKSNHGAGTGHCVGDAYPQCICDYNYTTSADGVRTPILYSSELCTAQACQCASISERTLYDTVCNLDCACHHGAPSGTCNYDAKACVCNYGPVVPAPYNNSYCYSANILTPSGQSLAASAFYENFAAAMNFSNLLKFLADAVKNQICVPNVLNNLPVVKSLFGR